MKSESSPTSDTPSETVPNPHEHPPHPETGPIVPILVNGKEVRIHRGRRTVAEIKAAGNVPLADELNQIVDGKLVPLADDGSVTIKGNEQFVSHPRDCASS